MTSADIIRVAIVDDEPLARSEMRRLLGMFDDIQIEFEADNAKDAIGKIREIKPDLLFLDIGLPEITGLHLAGLIAKENCMIIFCTADPSHALEAFDVNAIDYLHKPVELNRLGQALDKYRSRAGGASDRSSSNLVNMEKPILINDGGKSQLFTPKQIETIVSIGNYVKIKGKDLNIVAQHTMSYIENRLSRELFFRANRGTIVNLSKVKKVESTENGNYVLVMSSGEEVQFQEDKVHK